MTQHHQLEAALKQIRYPGGVSPTSGAYCSIKGQSFFPGGKGHGDETFPVEGVMYLGHNFDKLEGFQISVARGYEENLTWRRIRDSVIPFLPPRNIWFTNYFMGVLERESNIGPIQRSSDFAKYESDCWDFFKLQITLQRPRLIVALGKEVIKVLSPVDRLNIPGWNIGRSEAYGPLRFTPHLVQIPVDNGLHKTKIIAAYHPSFGRSSSQTSQIVDDSKFAASLLVS